VTLAHLGAEAYRLQLLSSLEGDFRRFGFGRIAGLDEAGRGSLAGPVVAAAVVMDPENLVPGVASPDLALIDAVALEGLAFPSLSVVRGESLSYSIACASILAKVERDRMMSDLHRRYPHYGFDSHKGYGAPEHLQALDDFGPCPEHRLTFRSVVPSAGEG
jgi:ribonuclease HII